MKLSISAKAWSTGLLCILAPVLLSAHPGHGHEGTVLHDLIHAAWIAATTAVIALSLFRWWKSIANRNDQ